MARKKKGKKKKTRKNNRPRRALQTAAKPPNTKDIVARAEELAATGQGGEALDLLREATGQHPENADALKALARMHMKRQSFDEAAQAYRQLGVCWPDDAQTFNALGTALTLAGRGDEAAKALKRAVDIDPDNPVYLANLGKMYMLDSNWYLAATYLERAMEAAPEEQRFKYQEALSQCKEGMAGSQVAPKTLASDGGGKEATPPAESQPAPMSAPLAGDQNHVEPQAIENENDYLGPTDESVWHPLDFAVGDDAFLAAAGHAACHERQNPLRMTLICLPGLDNFVDDLIAALRPEIEIRKVVSGDQNEIIAALADAEAVWIEWGNELAQWITNQAAEHLLGKRVVLRIHKYEVLTGLAEKINYQVINDVILVAPHIREVLLERKPEVADQVSRIHIVPNGVDLDKFALHDKPRGFNLAFLAHISYKKDPMVLLHAFAHLHRKDPRYRLHIGGDLSQLTYQMALKNFVRANNLQSAVAYHGLIKDVPAWLADMDYVVCSSLEEGHPVGILEAMAMGLQPLIYNWPGAEAFYPPEFMWNNIDEMIERVADPQSPAKVRGFVAANYSLGRQAESLRAMLLDEQEVDFAGFAEPQETPPPRPAGTESLSRLERAAANKAYGHSLLQAGMPTQADVVWERALAQSHYQDYETAANLAKLRISRGQWAELNTMHRSMAFEHAADGRYESMLQSMYLANYHAYMETGSYEHMKHDPAVDAVLRLVAKEVTPLAGYEKEITGMDPAKIKVAFGIEGLDQSQAPIRMILDLALGLDPQRFEVLLVSRLGISKHWLETANMLAGRGVRLLMGKGSSEFESLQMALYALRHIACDVLLLPAPWLSPWFNLLGCCGAAERVVKIISQTGGRETHFGQVMSNSLRALAEETVDGLYFGAFSGAPWRELRLRQANRNGQLNVLVAGRGSKLGNRCFWEALCRAQEKTPGLAISVAGCRRNDLSPDLPVPRKTRFLGFVDDMAQVMMQHDLLVDTWPTGGGMVIREACRSAIPILSYETDWNSRMSVDNDSHVTLHNRLIPGDLLLPKFDAELISATIARLADDHQFYNKALDSWERSKVLSRGEYLVKFQEAVVRLKGDCRPKALLYQDASGQNTAAAHPFPELAV